nr:MAG TPA: hypothetical protein [Siphoviridae sp. ctngg6]
MSHKNTVNSKTKTQPTILIHNHILSFFYFRFRFDVMNP